MLNISLDADALRPVIEAAVAETMARLTADSANMGDKLAFDEQEAARLLDIEPHVLRDARLRGCISASRITGRRIRYAKSDLLEYLQRNRVEARN